MTPRVQGLLDDWSKHPLGTADADKMQQACEVRMTHHQELFNFYAVKSDARLKFLTAQRDQRMMDQEVNRILKLDRLWWMSTRLQSVVGSAEKRPFPSGRSTSRRLTGSGGKGWPSEASRSIGQAASRFMGCAHVNCAARH